MEKQLTALDNNITIDNYYNELETITTKFGLPILNIPKENFEKSSDHEEDGSNCRLMHITNLTYEKDFPRLEAFENVVASTNNMQNCRFIYYLKGSKYGVEFYIGVAKNNKDANDPLSVRDYRDLLEKSFKGNLIGSKFSTQGKATRDTIKEEKIQTKKLQEELINPDLFYSVVLGVPSKNEDKENVSFQGIDRLVNIMSEIPFHLIIVWEPVSQMNVKEISDSVKQIYNELSFISKSSIQIGNQQSVQKTYTGQKGTNTNWDEHGSSSSKGGGTSKSESLAKGITYGGNYSETRELQNKTLQEIIKYIDDELLPRLKQGQAKGVFKTTMYLGAETKGHLSLLENSVCSIFQGNKSTFFPLHARRLPQNSFISKNISEFKFFDGFDVDSKLLPLCSQSILKNRASLSTWLIPAEISIVAGMPQKEVFGLELREQVGFGLNAKETDDDNIYLGSIYQEGSLVSNATVSLKKADLNKHIFIAGATGSGKTTTCHRLLASSKLPFLVIEPAKTEYRALLEDPNLHEENFDDKDEIKSRIENNKAYGEILVFTVGNEEGVPFRFNPFEFLKTENLSGHVDLLKACFMSSFDMDAAIPNLLEESLYRIYEKFGWDFTDNSNYLLEDRNEAWDLKNGGKYFPTISDYIDIFESVINEKGFDERLKNDYIGSIRGRLDSLRTGTKKLMFDTRLSVNFEDLLNRRVIIELEELKSGEDKSFIMGLIIGRLREALKAKNKEHKDYKHITLIEEAHRLLSAPQASDSNNRKLGVEMFCDLLAEVRKYGESLIIVDQIPSKLAPDVLKNTNTKIIHKIFSKDDKEVVGDTMALDDKQKNYLSHLVDGEAIVFTRGLAKPIDIQVEQLELVKTSDSNISDEQVYKAGWSYWEEHSVLFCPMLASLNVTTLNKEQLNMYARHIKYANQAISCLKSKKGEYFFNIWLSILSKSRDELGKEKADKLYLECLLMDILTKKFLGETNIANVSALYTDMIPKYKELVEKIFSFDDVKDLKEYIVNNKINNKYW